LNQDGHRSKRTPSNPFLPSFGPSCWHSIRAGNDELHRAALAANGLVRIYAGVVSMLLAQTGQRASAVAAIGAHGQTVRHRPQCFDGTGYTLQLNNPALLAELTGIDVVADFRSRDVAAGGQGRATGPRCFIARSSHKPAPTCAF
jgi:anhydro-N-acetylmuramic acid kinase